MDAARRLFARVLETPGGLKIMTIHSFCQSVLGRFPLEAGLAPHFKVLEEGDAKTLLAAAQQSILKGAENAGPDNPLSAALSRLSMILNAEMLEKLLSQFCSERRQVQSLLTQHFGVEGVYTKTCALLNVPPGKTAEHMLHAFCADGAFDREGLLAACATLEENGGKKDKERAESIQPFVMAKAQDRSALFEGVYRRAFLTQKGEILANLATKKVQQNNPRILEILTREAERIRDHLETVKASECALLTRDFMILGGAVLNAYQAAKEKRAALDFDDLILRTLALVEGRTMGLDGADASAWVMYKLDRGIDHILVDEAQDTNPEQWDILKNLCAEFFAGSGVRGEEDRRTLFVVGDEKQSIFSFQRAAPDRFHAMRDGFKAKAAGAGKVLEDIRLNISFRSCPAVLRAVDAVFAQDGMANGMGQSPVRHIPFRRRQPGLVECWPIFGLEDSAEAQGDVWTAPVKAYESRSGATRLADTLGDNIAGWIRNKEWLPARNRAIRAGDILILVRTRTKFVAQMVRALKIRGVPVSGADRMVLNDQIAVQDLVTAARFALLPEDDLSLATLLKSPFIGWDDDALFARAHGRPGSLWAAIREDGRSGMIADWLQSLIRTGGRESPFAFFSRILNDPCPTDEGSGLRAMRGRMGEDILDPLNEFLNDSLMAEREDAGTLEGFVHHFCRRDREIKREMAKDEGGGGAVRIMTVHGAKGLEAPVVILPDTLRTPQSVKRDKVLWPDRSGFPVPLLIPSAGAVPEGAAGAWQTIADRQEEETRRLLYVAITRAEDRLYVAGYKGKNAPLNQSWYNHVKAGLSSLPDTETCPFPMKGGEEDVMLRLADTLDIGPPDRVDGKTVSVALELSIPPWLFSPAPVESDPPRPLSPSRPAIEEPAAASPIKTGDAFRFRRGNVTHTLLQILPDLPDHAREAAALSYVARPAFALPTDVQDSIVGEVMKILSHPQFAAVFGEGSLAEVPVTGMIDEKTLISGQIDRLVVTEKEILILDYKTNRPPPESADDIPPLYLRQMRAYRAALLSIYPGRAVRCALLWTDGPRLMDVPLTDAPPRTML